MLSLLYLLYWLVPWQRLPLGFVVRLCGFGRACQRGHPDSCGFVKIFGCVLRLRTIITSPKLVEHMLGLGLFTLPFCACAAEAKNAETLTRTLVIKTPVEVPAISNLELWSRHCCAEICSFFCYAATAELANGLHGALPSRTIVFREALDICCTCVVVRRACVCVCCSMRVRDTKALTAQYVLYAAVSYWCRQPDVRGPCPR